MKENGKKNNYVSLFRRNEHKFISNNRFMKGQFEQKLQPKGIPLDVINMADYGMMNGEKVLDQAISLMGSSN